MIPEESGKSEESGESISEFKGVSEISEGTRSVSGPLRIRIWAVLYESHLMVLVKIYFSGEAEID